MKLTFAQIIPAYKALQTLSNQLLPLPLAWALTKAKQALQPHIDFYGAEEHKAIEAHGGTLHEGGSITFEDNEHFKAYAERAKELNDMEAEVDMKPIVLDVEALGGVQISVNDLAALQPLLKE